MRTETEIFEEIGALCRKPGYVHALAFLCFRDNMIKFKEEVTAKEMMSLFRADRLLRTEISTLLGLMVKGEIDYSLPEPKVVQEYITVSETLLEELHNVMSGEMMKGMFEGREEVDIKQLPHRGAFLREPIFYGGEAAYSFQYRDFSPTRYRADDGWLYKNKGFGIDAARSITRSIAGIQTKNLAATEQAMRTRAIETWTLIPGYTLTSTEISRDSGVALEEVESFMQSFALDGLNERFQSVSDFNETNASPFLRVDEGTYLLLQYYSLVEALYESPFFWMFQDKAYRATASENRGKFTEAFTAERLAKVFGEGRVHQNVDLLAKKGEKFGEIDVLVVFGDRLIVVQAKSKRLTIEARKGNDGQLQGDFQKAIQDSYNQALDCAKHLIAGDCRILSADGEEIPLEHSPKEVFLFCIVADNYPALSFQARQFLHYEQTEHIKPPFVMDVFFLDAMTEMLESSLRLLSYVKQRVEYNERLSATHELTTLSYHLKSNLWLDDEHSLVMLADDIAVDLDLAMSVRRDGVPGADTPEGILTQFAGTTYESLIRQIENNPEPANIDLGFLLLTLDGETCDAINYGLKEMARMARADGKAHDFTIGVGDTGEGITFHCNPASEQEATERLFTHCHGRKYAQHASTWFGLCVDTRLHLRFGIRLDFPWERSAEMDARTANLPKSTKVKNMAAMLRARKEPKVGRNEKCPCGSGIKYKKCCLGR